MAEVPIRKLGEYVYTPRAQWVASEHFVNMTFQVFDTYDPDILTIDECGNKIIPSGAPYPANDETCFGLIVNDANVTPGTAEVAVMMQGFIYEERLPVELTPEAVEGLKNKIIPRNGYWLSEVQ